MTAIIVLGSGIIGASIAYHLAIRGGDVTLVDRAPPASAPGATWASAGGLRSQGRHAAEHPITLAAARRWPSLPAELDADLELVLGGHLHIAETEAEVQGIEHRIAADRAGGIAIERLCGGDIASMAPALTGSARAGAWTKQDGQANPVRTARAFVAAARRAGCRCLYDRRGTPAFRDARLAGVRLEDGDLERADIVVLATGAWSPRILRELGIEVAMHWRGLQMVSSIPVGPLLRPTVTAAGRNLSLKQTPSGALMIGGRWFARPCGPEPAVEADADHTARQWQQALAILPVLAGLVPSQVWAGAEAQSPDGLPLIGRLDADGLYLAAGFSNHGFQLSPAIGALVANDILTGAEPLLHPFDPGRVVKPLGKQMDPQGRGVALQARG